MIIPSPSQRADLQDEFGRVLARIPDLVAIHEAGHAVAYVALGIKIDYVELKQQGGGTKPLFFCGPIEWRELSAETVDEEIVVSLAGVTATKEFLGYGGVDSLGGDGDLSAISHVCTQCGLDARTTVERLEPRTVALVRKYEAEIRRVAAALLVEDGHHRLAEHEVVQIVRPDPCASGAWSGTALEHASALTTLNDLEAVPSCLYSLARGRLETVDQRVASDPYRRVIAELREIAGDEKAMRARCGQIRRAIR
jgi:hypothetical protein